MKPQDRPRRGRTKGTQERAQLESEASYTIRYRGRGAARSRLESRTAGTQGEKSKAHPGGDAVEKGQAPNQISEGKHRR